MENNWRKVLAQDSRHKIVSRIMDTLQKHMPFSGEDGIAELWKIAHRFEEKIFRDAQNQNDYLRRISMKMTTLETRTQNALNGTLPTNANAAIQNPATSMDSGVTVQHSSRNQGQSMPGLSQTQPWQSAQPGMSAVGTASSTSLAPSVTSGSSIPQQASLLNSTGQPSANSGSSLNVNTNGQALSQQNVQVAANGASLAQNMNSQNALLNHNHRGQMTRQQQPQGQSQGQSQSQSQAQSQQPLVQHVGGVPQSGTMLQQSAQLQQQSIQQQMQQAQPIQQQQPQQQLPAQVQGQPQQPMQQLQAQQQIRLQAAAMLKPKYSQQQQGMQPQPSLLLQQQTGLSQPLGGLQQQSLLQPQQQHTLQQNNVQASQQILQQQLQAKVAAQQQQQQQQQQQASSLMSLIAQPLQPPPQSQAASSTSQQSALLSQQQNPQQLGSMQQDQQRLLQPGMQQPASLMEQQKQQPSQTQQSTTVDSSALNGQGHAGSTDTQEIVWTKMQALKDKYLQDMKDLYTMLATRSQQAMPREQLEKLSHYKTVLQRMIPYLLAPRGSLPKEFKIDKVEAFEKQIMSIMDTFKRRKQVPQQQTMQQQAPPQVPPSAGMGQVPGVQQQVHQLSQSMQQDKAIQQTHQMSTPGLNMTDLASNPSNNSLSMVQSNMSTLPQGISSGVPSSTLGGLQGTGTNALHQSNILNALQPNLSTIQQQPQQQSIQHEMSQSLQLKQLQQRQQMQIMQQQKQPQPQPVILPVSQMMVDAQNENKAAKHLTGTVMNQMFGNQQHPQIGTRMLLPLHNQQQPKSSLLQPTSSPQMSSPPPMSPQSDFQMIGNSAVQQVSKIGTPSQAATPPFMIPSPSPMLEDPELRPLTPVISAGGHVATPSNGHLAAVGTPGISVSPLLDYAPSPLIANTQGNARSYHPGDERQIASEPPLERLVKVINSVSHRVLASAVDDMNAVISLSDMLGGSAPGSQSRAAIGEDLAQVTKCRSQARVLSLTEGSAVNKKVKRRIDSMALSIVSSNGSVVNSLHWSNGLDGETESTATSRIKCAKIEIRSLVDEIDDVNEQLIDTHVEIDDNGIEEAASEGKGVVVTCAYNAIAMSPNVAFRSRLFHMVAISPLRLLVPSQYPDCSPIVMVDETVPDFNHPVSRTARDEFSRLVRCLPQPVSLADMVKAWDMSARSAVVEAATLQGGGCLSSCFSCWESCVS